MNKQDTPKNNNKDNMTDVVEVIAQDILDAVQGSDQGTVTASDGTVVTLDHESSSIK